MTLRNLTFFHQVVLEKLLKKQQLQTILQICHIWYSYLY
jgi:hypothetical protein